MINSTGQWAQVTRILLFWGEKYAECDQCEYHGCTVMARHATGYRKRFLANLKELEASLRSRRAYFPPLVVQDIQGAFEQYPEYSSEPLVIRDPGILDDLFYVALVVCRESASSLALITGYLACGARRCPSCQNTGLRLDLVDRLHQLNSSLLSNRK